MIKLEIPHGIMFHHFHDSTRHIKCQGSLSREEFIRLIDCCSQNYNILSADEFYSRVEKGTLRTEDVCLTFDDGLRCQYDIALDVLKEKGLRAFWFIYTSPLEGEKEKLEVYHHFRFSMFENIDFFYDTFFETARLDGFDIDVSLERFNPDRFLINSPFYTVQDKKFRYVRDVVLGQKNYYSIMDDMIDKSDYSIENSIELLWMDKKAMVDLSNDGHIIGVHSHTHPTRMTEQGYEGQLYEYGHCKSVLESIVKSPILAAAYPCGQYDDDSISVLKEIGIRIAFNAFMTKPYLGDGLFEIPREDHANIMRNYKEV